MILKQNEIEEAADKSSDHHYGNYDNHCTYESAIDGFKQGVEFAELKLQEIAIEFGKFAYDHYEDSYLSFEELFQLFLKKRNE